MIFKIIFNIPLFLLIRILLPLSHTLWYQGNFKVHFCSLGNVFVLDSRGGQFRFDIFVPPPFISRKVSKFSPQIVAIHNHLSYTLLSVKFWSAFQRTPPSSILVTWPARIIEGLKLFCVIFLIAHIVIHIFDTGD